MPSPVSIYLSNHQIIRIYNFARLTVSNHYQRMWNNESTGIQKIVIGKAGEIAAKTYLKMSGIKVGNVNTRINSGIDKFDLQIGNCFISIKTKSAKCSIPTKSQYSQWFLHIPKDQYLKIKGICDYIIAIFIGNIGDNVEWKSMISLRVDIVGIISIDKFHDIKILHKAGQKIANGFTLPPPDSYGVKWKDLDSISNFIDKFYNNIYTVNFEQVNLSLIEKRLSALEEQFEKRQEIIPF